MTYHMKLRMLTTGMPVTPLKQDLICSRQKAT